MNTMSIPSDVQGKTINFKNVIVQYVRSTTHQNKLVGAWVAGCTDDDELHIGYSQCCKDDIFTKTAAKKIAFDNAFKYENVSDHKIPYKVRKNFNEFMMRCSRYYKDKTAPYWVGRIK